MTVKTLLPVPVPASGLVTVTLRAPVLAFEAIVMFAVRWPESTKLVELTVMPVPENAALAPLTKPVPVIVMFWLLAPCPRELGLVELTVGPALTVKTLVPVPAPASGLVTVTSRAPVLAFEAIVMFAVRWLESTKLVELTVMPVPENETLAPLAKPVPLIVTLWLPAPCPSELGLVEDTVGAALTVKAEVLVAVLPSPLVIETSRAPVLAVEETVTLAVSWVELLNVVELTVIPDPNDAASVGPLMKPVPVIVMFWLVAPCPRELGLSEEIVGAALTLKTPLPVPTPASGLVTVTLPAPVLAVEEMLMFAVSWVELTNVVELTVIPDPNDAASAGPLSKPVPVMVTL